MPSQSDLYRRLRRRLGLSQSQLATRLGITSRQVQNLENGVTPIREHHLLALQALLETSMDPELLYADGDQMRVCVPTSWNDEQVAEFAKSANVFDPDVDWRPTGQWAPCQKSPNHLHVRLERQK